jgi:Glycine zipper
MRNIRGFVLVPALVLGAACGKSDSNKMDDALRSDLSTAAQQQPYQPQQVVSPGELGVQPGAAQQQYVGQGTAYSAPAPARVRTRTVYRDRPVYSSGSGSSNESNGGYSRPAPQRTEKHGGRDAAIGAAAGAVIGATASKNKVQGGVIGAAAGAILGGVVGNNVDIKKH